MPHEAVGPDLEQGGMPATAGAVNGALGGAVHLEHVHAVDELGRHVIAARMLHHVGDRRDALERRPHPVAIVLTQEDHGELPHGSHVQGLVEGPDVHGSLAEEAEAHLLAAAILDREAEAGRERDVTPDDRVPAHEAARRVEEMHRPALTLRAARRLPEQLRHHRGRGDAARQGLPVLAIRRDDVVFRPERRQRPDAHRLLADVEVAEPPDLPEGVGLRGFFLEAADQEHVA